MNIDRERAKSRKSYDKYREQRIEKVMIWHHLRRETILLYKLSHPCIDCGETDPMVLDFDHRKGETKLFNIGRGRSSRGLHALIKEISKCDIRCANCHRKSTYKEHRIRGWALGRPRHNEKRRSLNVQLDMFY